jgi:hypothetical protein
MADVSGFECLLTMWAQADWLFGPFADEDPAARG